MNRVGCTGPFVLCNAAEELCRQALDQVSAVSGEEPYLSENPQRSAH
jgi:hypothetical protein